MTASYILKLHDIRKDDFALVGGKAANLAKLAQWDLPTLDGFCVTTEGYRNFLQLSNLDKKIAGIIGDVEIDNLEQVTTSSEKIRTLIESAKLPTDVIQSIQSAYISLGEPAVAVRSSATAEDLPNASFAGQQESYLNIIGFEQVVKHVRLCWGSLWTPRAIQYRARQGIGNNRVYMAVIVQQMIQAEVSGVMFTTNPMNDDSDQIVINASYGLGESIVSGIVTPDTFILDKASLRVLKTEIGIKETIISSTETGGTQNQQTDIARQNLPSLPHDYVALLGELGKQVEGYYESPQDIEWAYARGEFFLLQARPITTKKLQKELSASQYNRLEKFLLAFLLDYFPNPPYHFDRSVLLNLVEVTLGLSKIFGLRPSNAREVLKVEPDGTIRLIPVLPKLNWYTPIGAIRGTIQAFRSLKTDPSIFYQKRWPVIEAQLKDLREHNLHEMADAELLSLIRKYVSIRDYDIFVARFDYMLGGWVAMIVLPLLLRLITDKQTSGNLYFSLMSGLDHPTAIMNRQLRSLARTALSVAAIKDILEKGVNKTTWSEIEVADEGQVFLTEVAAFLDRFGVRTGMLIPFPSAPIWQENPDKVLSLIEIMLRNPDSLLDGSIDRQKQKSHEAESDVFRLAGKFPFSLVKMQALTAFLIKYVQATITERDWIIFAYESVNQPIRQAMLEIGQRLSERNFIPEANDIRFLSLGEAEELLTKPSTDELIIQFEKELRIRKLARSKTTANWNVATVVPVAKMGAYLLKGTAASPGTASGVARIILSESEFSKLNAGEILVCRATNPSWTPLFAIASGVVADTGGPLSHAAIVAREYGIPAVLGTQSATVTMVDGQLYTVDGTNGQVWVSKDS